MLIVMVAVGALVWSGVGFVLDILQRRHSRPDLADRLLPFQPHSLGDEAQEWLQRQ
jgi:hypothetical protein